MKTKIMRVRIRVGELKGEKPPPPPAEIENLMCHMKHIFNSYYLACCICGIYFGIIDYLGAVHTSRIASKMKVSPIK